MADNPKRKLKIQSVGAGDPTFKLVINLESMSGDPNPEVDLGIIVHLGLNGDLAMQTTATIPTNKDLTLLSSFNGPEAYSNNIQTSINFSFPEELDIENHTGHTVIATNLNSISFANIDHILTPNVTLGQIANLGIQLKSGTNNKVFLKEQNNGLDLTVVLNSSDLSYEWKALYYEANPILFSLFNTAENSYLKPSASSNLGLSWSPSRPDATDGWSLEKANPTTDLYYIYNSTKIKYLGLINDQVQMIDNSSSSNKTSWFLHINTINF